MDRSLALVRIVVAILLGIHGWTRAAIGGVAPFGEYLQAAGFPLGISLAWAITTYEIVASACLALGRFVAPVCAGFLLILLSGIILVHAPNGWFVVGAGRNGVEFSVLLIACLVAVALPHLPRTSRS
jgi:putative oxidoreductase